MHIQFSLIKDGKNVFESSQNHGELSQEAYYFIGGLLAHSKEMALITNPIVNSYKRLVPGYDAPTELTWNENNQNSLEFFLFRLYVPGFHDRFERGEGYVDPFGYGSCGIGK